MKILYCSSKLIFYLKNNSMYPFEDIPVCLDLRERDDSLVRYRNFLVEKFKQLKTFCQIIYGLQN